MLILLQNFTLISIIITLGLGVIDSNLSCVGAYDAPLNPLNVPQGPKRTLTEISSNTNTLPHPPAKYQRKNDFESDKESLAPSSTSGSQKKRLFLKDPEKIKQVLALLEVRKAKKRLTYPQIATKIGCTENNVEYLAAKHGLCLKSQKNLKKTGKENNPPKEGPTQGLASSINRTPTNELQEIIQQRLVTNFKNGTWESSTVIATSISATVPCTRNNVRAFTTKSKLTKGGFDVYQENPADFFMLNPHLEPLFTSNEVSKLTSPSSINNVGLKDENDPYFNFLPFNLSEESFAP